MPVTEIDPKIADPVKSPAARGGGRSAGLRLKTFVLISMMAAFNPLGNVLLGKGMKEVGATYGWAPSEIARFFFRAFTTGTIWVAIALLLAFFVSYLLVLSWADYTFVQPASAVSSGLTALLAVLVLHEVVTPERWAGVLLICVGVFVVGRTHPQTTEKDAC